MSSPSKEESSPSQQDDLAQMEDTVDTHRNRANKKLKTSLSGLTNPPCVIALTDYEDCEILFNKARALIMTNDEIWERCRANKVATGGIFVDSIHGGQVRATDKHVVFRRAGPVSVAVRAVRARSFYGTGGMGGGIVEVRHTTDHAKPFSVPPALPKELGCIFALTKNESDDLLPDYKDYLSRVSLLNKKTFVHFLPLFISHLEEIQVYLGEIENWIMEVEFARQFLTENFHMYNQETGARCGSSPNVIEQFEADFVGEYNILFDITQEKQRKALHLMRQSWASSP